MMFSASSLIRDDAGNGCYLEGSERRVGKDLACVNVDHSI
jgi:hypothetical protein